MLAVNSFIFMLQYSKQIIYTLSENIKLSNYSTAQGQLTPIPPQEQAVMTNTEVNSGCPLLIRPKEPLLMGVVMETTRSSCSVSAQSSLGD